jgi:hypothetical protein
MLLVDHLLRQNASSAGSLSSLPLAIAERKGFFIREGLKLDVVPIPGGTDRIVAALDKGEIDAGKNATPYLIQAVLKGSDAVAIIAQTTNPVYSLIVRPEIKSFADLKGKVIGLSTPGDTTHCPMRLRPQRHQDFGFQAKAVGYGARFDLKRAVRGGADGPAGRSGRGQMGLSPPRLYLRRGGSDFQRRHGARLGREDGHSHAAGARLRLYDSSTTRGIMAKLPCYGVIEGLGRAARQVLAPTSPTSSCRKGELSLSAFNQVLALMARQALSRQPQPQSLHRLEILQAAGIQKRLAVGLRRIFIAYGSYVPTICHVPQPNAKIARLQFSSF